jgi:hypothetical protein
MLKRSLIGPTLLLFCACLILISGCASTTSTATTTTTSSSNSTSSTTTAPSGPNTVSGTISWTGATPSASVCDVLVFLGGTMTYTNSFPVSAGQTSVSYTTSGMPNDTYYVFGVIYKGVTTSPGKPRVGDQAGEYSDGYIDASQSAYFDHTGTPQAVIVNGSGATGITFSLKATCTNAMP